MGRIFPKTLMKWREPEAVRGARESIAERRRSRLARPLAASVTACMVMGLWYLATKNPSKTPPSVWTDPPPAWVAAIMAVGLGLFVAYVVPLLYRLIPVEIHVADYSIFRMPGSPAAGSGSWKHADIVDCRIVTRESGGGTLALLHFTTKQGADVTIGIAPEVDLDELRRVLSERGVAVERAVERADEGG